MQHFPYMDFARTRAHLAAHSLTQSGMPTPPPSEFELRQASTAIDAGYAGNDALPKLEQRIARELDVDPRRVIATLGATGGMHLAAWAFFQRGSRVASEWPCYEPLRALPAVLGADCVQVRRRADDGWRLDPRDVDAALGSARPGHVFPTNSHNPTGALLDGATMAELAAVAARHAGILVCCEIYLEFAPRVASPSAYRIAPNAVSISSLTKAYGLGGLRCGWIVLGEGLIERRKEIEDLGYLTYVDLPTASLRASALAFDRLGELRARAKRVEVESRPVFLEWLRSTPGLNAHRPELGLTAFPRVDGVEDTRALAEHLLERHAVGVVAGEHFGAAGHLRIGHALPPDRLRPALDRLAEGLASFRAAHRNR